MLEKKARKQPKEQAPAEGDAAPRLSFEAALARLSAIVVELESGELTLEQSLARFEEGTLLARQTERELDAAESRVEKLLGFDEDGRPVTEELEVS